MSRRLAAALCFALVLTACAGGTEDGDGGPEGSDGDLTFWTVVTWSPAFEQMEQTVGEYAESVGVAIDLVPIEVADLPTAMTASAGAGDLPDVVLYTTDLTDTWAQEGILDVDAAGDVIDRLGADTFYAPALELVQYEGAHAAVPSDGWGQLIFYRTDLFDEAGLAPPTNLDAIATAAEALHDEDTMGFLAGTDGSNLFTQQGFEHYAMSAGCNIVDEAGDISFDTPECVDALQWYTDVLGNYSAVGPQDALSTAAMYLDGKAAMMTWSPHFLDWLWGLVEDPQPTCPECEDDTEWLAERTAYVTELEAADGGQVQFGQTLNLGITSQADTEAASDLVEHLLSEGYIDFLSAAPQGRFPMRAGTPDDPTAFVDQWSELEVSDDMTISDVFGEQGIEDLSRSATNFQRWAFAEGEGRLVNALYGELIVPRHIREVLDGGTSVPEAAASIQDEVQDLR